MYEMWTCFLYVCALSLGPVQLDLALFSAQTVIPENVIALPKELLSQHYRQNATSAFNHPAVGKVPGDIVKGNANADSSPE
jgi:hypothetical protein